MRILTEQEAAAVRLKSKGVRNEVIDAIRDMKRGETALVRREEWRNKMPLTNGRLSSIGRYSVRTLADDSGWLVTRK